jgi:hypothetical protein
MDQIQKRLALKFRLNKIDNAGIYGPILLNELYAHTDKNCSTELVQGYLQITSPGGVETCWHVWVRDTTTQKIYDINEMLAMMNDPNFRFCKFCHLEELGPGDQEKDINIDEEVKGFYEVYKEDKKKFWKTIPSIKIKNLRAKLFRELK